MRHSASIVIAFLILMLSTIVGCPVNYSTVRDTASGPATLYRISKTEALQLAHNALSEMFPGHEITDIKGPPSGYSTSYRQMLDTYSEQVFVIPALGVDTSGSEVKGYYFYVSGTGSAVVSGGMKNSDLFDRIKQLAENSGRPTRVTTWKVDYSIEDSSQTP